MSESLALPAVGTYVQSRYGALWKVANHRNERQWALLINVLNPLWHYTPFDELRGIDPPYRPPVFAVVTCV